MGIQKFIFFSIHNCDKHPEVPLMEIKYCTEKFLRDSGLNHVVIRLCGFMQVSSSNGFIWCGESMSCICTFNHNVDTRVISENS